MRNSALSGFINVSARAALERARKDTAGLTGSAAIELTAVLFNLLLVTDDPSAQASIGTELVVTRTRLLGATHPKTLEARITAAELVDDPERLRAELPAACNQLHDLHPSHAQIIGTCSFELGWTAAVANDLPTARTMIVQSLDALGSDDEETRNLAESYLLILDGNAPIALKRLRALQVVAADAPWWRVMSAADASIAAALAEPGDARRDLTTADELLAKIAPAMAPAVVHRRQRAIAALRGR